MDMDMEVDLDINNYDLVSLLTLFKMPLQFDETDMRKAKKIVLATHPDKSRLDKKYFLFFSKAYKLLLEIHQFKTKSTNRNVNEYSQVEYREDHDNAKQMLVNKLTTNKDFLKTFNALFDENYVNQENDGYGEWLESNEDINGDSKEQFSIVKTQSRALTVNQEVEGISYYSGNVLGEINNNYGSNQYEDLKHAYTNGLVLGVDESDFKEGANTLDELRQERASQQIEPYSKQEAEEKMMHSKQSKDIQDTQRAYRIAQQQDKIQKGVDSFWGSILRISNNK